MVNGQMQDLKRQEKQQMAAILRSARAKQEAKVRHCLTSMDSQAPASSSSSTSDGRTENIVHALRAAGAAGSLYTGVVVCPQSTKGGGKATELRNVMTQEAAQATIKTQVHGRHFKTELVFPRV